MKNFIFIASIAAALAGSLQPVYAASAPLDLTPVVCVTDGCTTDASGKSGR